MYTQIIDEIPISPGMKHKVAIRYTRTPTTSYVEYFLDSKLVSRVSNIGVPLDVQGVDYTGISPAIPGATGEDLRTKINSFSIGHGTFSLLDAFPYQWGGSTFAPVVRSRPWKRPPAASACLSRRPSACSANAGTLRRLYGHDKHGVRETLSGPEPRPRLRPGATNRSEPTSATRAARTP